MLLFWRNVSLLSQIKRKHAKVSSNWNDREEQNNIKKSLENSEPEITCLQQSFTLGSLSSSQAGRQRWDMGAQNRIPQAENLSPAGKKVISDFLLGLSTITYLSHLSQQTGRGLCINKQIHLAIPNPPSPLFSTTVGCYSFWISPYRTKLISPLHAKPSALKTNKQTKPYTKPK